MITVKEFIDRFEDFCPLSLAEKGDPCGLHFGSLEQQVSKIMVALDCRPEVIDEAIKNDIDLLIVKHPPIFSSIKRFVEDNEQTKMYAKIIRENIAIYAAHTNMDIIDNGLNDWFCDMLDIKNTSYLSETHSFPAKLLRFDIPKNDIGLYKNILESHRIDFNYQTTYSESSKLENYKMEVNLNFKNEKIVVNLLSSIKSFSAYDYEIIELTNNPTKFGIGRIGNLEQPISLIDLIEKVKVVFNLPHLTYISRDITQLVQRIAICGGTGGKLFTDAIKKDADVYITGDVYYHTGHDMLSERLNVIDPGHYIESVCIQRLVKLFDEWKQELGWEVSILPSEVNTNPFQFS